MRDAIDQYYADKGKYPESLDVQRELHRLAEPLSKLTSRLVPAERRYRGSIGKSLFVMMLCAES